MQYVTVSVARTGKRWVKHGVARGPRHEWFLLSPQVVRNFRTGTGPSVLLRLKRIDDLECLARVGELAIDSADGEGLVAHPADIARPGRFGSAPRPLRRRRVQPAAAARPLPRLLERGDGRGLRRRVVRLRRVDAVLHGASPVRRRVPVPAAILAHARSPASTPRRIRAPAFLTTPGCAGVPPASMQSIFKSRCRRDAGGPGKAARASHSVRNENRRSAARLARARAIRYAV